MASFLRLFTPRDPKYDKLPESADADADADDGAVSSSDDEDFHDARTYHPTKPQAATFFTEEVIKGDDSSLSTGKVGSAGLTAEAMTMISWHRSSSVEHNTDVKKQVVIIQKFDDKGLLRHREAYGFDYYHANKATIKGVTLREVINKEEDWVIIPTDKK